MRTQRAVPLLDSLKPWLELTLGQISVKSGLAKAIKYSLAHWRALTRYCEDGRIEIGRVEMWRGGRRSGLSVTAPFVWRCPKNLTIAPFPHPAHRTGRADFPHPALFQNIKPSRLRGWPRASAGVSAPMFRRGTGRSIGDTPFPAFRVCASTRSAGVAQRTCQYVRKSALPALG